MLLNKKNDLTKKKIGFIGVGIMGEGMVCKLIEANHKPVSYTHLTLPTNREV